MDKQIIVYNGILSNINESQIHYTDQKKPDTKEYTLHDFIYVVQEQAKLIYGDWNENHKEKTVTMRNRC